ncbi:MAG: SDR family oxidoreductase [Bacteroidales bacterium]
MYNNKNVIITGSSGGIGKSLVAAYAGLGARVFAIDVVNPEQESENVIYCNLDQRNSLEVNEFFRNLTAIYGQAHILINNAAVSRFNKSIFDISDEEFRNVIDVNLCGVFYCCRAFVHANKGAGYGRIINIASTRWLQNEPGWEAYGASKGGLVSLTASLAVSLSDESVTVNAISPGWIETGDYALLREQDHKQHPAGRVGKPMDIVKACLFLSDPENDFINGENLVVDGGMTKKMVYIE